MIKNIFELGRGRGLVHRRSHAPFLIRTSLFHTLPALHMKTPAPHQCPRSKPSALISSGATLWLTVRGTWSISIFYDGAQLFFFQAVASAAALGVRAVSLQL